MSKRGDNVGYGYGISEGDMRDYGDAHFAVHLANQELVKRTFADELYVEQRRRLDHVMLLQAKAKWLLWKGTGAGFGFTPPGTRADVAHANALFRDISGYAEEARAILAGERANGARTTLPSLHVDDGGTETTFVDGVPVVPSVGPIVVLQGSWERMGAQYARQLAAIYGTWILAPTARYPLSDDELGHVRAGEALLRELAPGIADFARGFATASRELGLPMSYWQSVSLWTGRWAPFADGPKGFGYPGLTEGAQAAYEGGEGVREPELCSGACAWGSATADGSLVLSSTNDSDILHTATIVAFPDDGHSFVYTPFTPTGHFPIVGQYFFAGHPGINSAGLAYVHHGGAHCSGYEEGTPGVGLRRGASTIWMLSQEGSSRATLQRELAWPVGDSGSILGSVGGFYADSDYAYVLEARGEPPIVREQSFDRDGTAYDFLYATNNFVSPDAGHCGSPPADGYAFDPRSGWYTEDLASLQDPSQGVVSRRAMSVLSRSRNDALFALLAQGNGEIDRSYMAMMYRHGLRVDDSELDEVVEAWRRGHAVAGSAANRANALTAVAQPDAGPNGWYAVCVGPARRGVLPLGGRHGYYTYDETNEFWEIQLAETPAAIAEIAGEVAREDIGRARGVVDELDPAYAGAEALRGWLGEAERRARAADAWGEGDDVGTVAKALREVARAQVRARQVRSAVAPPPETPDEWRARGRADSGTRA